jgi:NTE family protein
MPPIRPYSPLIRASECQHALIVQVTPLTSDRLPKTARDISQRLEQIQFNATLNSELEALKLGKMIGVTNKLRRLRIGRISAHEEFEGLSNESAGNLDWAFLQRLRSSGGIAADLWLRQDMPQGASGVSPVGADEAAS